MSTAPNRIAVHVTAAGERALRNRHPWIFEGAIDKIGKGAATGALAVLFDRKRRFMGIGLYDASSPIRVRVLQHQTQATIDADWFAGRVNDALTRRAALADDEHTTGYRLINGENDGLPGLVADRYDKVVVIKLDTAAWAPHLPHVLAPLQAIQGVAQIVLRLSRSVIERESSLQDGRIIHGPPEVGDVPFLEHGLRFTAAPIQGQKTGFFLDQRDNRRRFADFAKMQDVLDVFCCNGGFSLYAARAGARSTTSIDLSAQALASVEHHFQENRDISTVRDCRLECLQGDAFAHMRELADADRRFGLIVVDPPPFARKQADIDKALKAYRYLAVLALNLIKRGGHIMMASCSSRVSATAFREAVAAAQGRSGLSLQIFEEHGHALDHPVTFPEGAYLKSIMAIAK